ncbi:uncharacterized protein LOC134764669 [Penaeus indicus]|uniref:uncharacterized protein LOC134764669 n=1 Tax=Penaeus indicus TaxID=29960 RepID=UPI00300D3F0D
MMADENREIKASIRQELDTFHRRLRDSYRPDLKDEADLGVPPGNPIFHDLEPHFFPSLESLDLKPEDLEKHGRQVSVPDLLTTQLDEEATTLPSRVLVVGRPESGKTALFAELIHLWLHDRSKVRGMARYDALIAIQCLGLQPPPDPNEKTKLSVLEEVLKRLPESCGKFGEEKIKKIMSEMEVLLLVDSLDDLPPGWAMDETSFSPWLNACVVAFSGLEFMQDHAHALRYACDRDHLVLRLWGGMSANPVIAPRGASESIAELSGGLSGALFNAYCQRLCQVHGKEYAQFKEYLNRLMMNLSMEIRKPFNTYVAFHGWKVSSSFTAKTISEFYFEWFELWSRIYKTKVHRENSDATSLIKKSSDDIAKLALDAFAVAQKKLLVKKDELHDFDERKAFFAHTLVPHYNSSGEIQTFTFRIAAHQLYFSANYIRSQLQEDHSRAKHLLPPDQALMYRPMIPMVMGLTKDLQHFSEIEDHIVRLVDVVQTADTTSRFEDPIINHVLQVLGESGRYNRMEGKHDSIVKKLLDTLPKSNWYVLNGNMLPEALKALCERGHGLTESGDSEQENEDGSTGEGKPQKLSFQIVGPLRETPGLCKLIEAISRCNIRVSLLLDATFNGEDEQPVDAAVKALQTKGRASLGKLTGFLKDLSILDSHPATRRIYALSLRIQDVKQYEALYRLTKRSNKLTRIALRIPNISEIKVKKIREIPICISHLSVYIEGVSDETLGMAIGAWRAIRGTTSRKDQEYLRFWAVKDKRLTASNVIQVIEADLPAKRIEVPLQQPVSEYDQNRIQEKLNAVKGVDFTVMLLGSRQYPRKNLRPIKKEEV